MATKTAKDKKAVGRNNRKHIESHGKLSAQSPTEPRSMPQLTATSRRFGLVGSELNQPVWGVIGDGAAVLTHATYEEANIYIMIHTPESGTNAKIKMTLVTSDAAQRASATGSTI